MLDGKKPKKKTDWTKHESPRLQLSHKHEHEDYKSCASAALSMITGLSTKTLDRMNGNKEEWTWRDTAVFLKQRGYTMLEVTKELICDTHWKRHNLNDNHLLWCCCRVGPEDYSAVLAHGGKLYHNFEEVRDALFFLNKPTEYVVVISHPKLKDKPAPKKKTSLPKLVAALTEGPSVRERMRLFEQYVRNERNKR